MESLSRRNMLRLAGGAAGVGGVLGSGFLAPAHAALRVRLWLDSGDVVPLGGLLTLRVVADPAEVRSIVVRDSTGLPWTRVFDGRWSEIYTATATAVGSGTITVVSTGIDGSTQSNTVGYQVADGLVGPQPTLGPLIGMSARATLWDQRLAEVGSGVTSRRIFADLAGGPTDQLRLVEEAHADNMLPVISYKLGGDIARGASGGFNAVAEEAAERLDAYGRPTAVAVWHEPNSDMSPAQYAAISRQLLPIFKRGQVRVGPILNGFLLDNQVGTFSAFAPDELFEIWQWVGIDTYEGGTMASPGERKPAERIPALSAYVRSRGYGDLPLGIGEYNGYSGETIAAAGEALLSTPNVWFGCMWNSEGERARELAGERLAAFRRTLADPRAGSL